MDLIFTGENESISLICSRFIICEMYMNLQTKQLLLFYKK